MIHKKLKYVAMAIGGIALVFALIGATMWLWNALIPSIFHLREISYWEAAGLFILSKIFFGGLKDHDSAKKHHDRRNHDVARRFEQRLANMTSEEFEELKEKWANHSHRHHNCCDDDYRSRNVDKENGKEESK